VDDLAFEDRSLPFEDVRVARLHQLQCGHGWRQWVAQLVTKDGEELILRPVRPLRFASRRFRAAHFLVTVPGTLVEQGGGSGQRALQAYGLGNVSRRRLERAAVRDRLGGGGGRLEVGGEPA
jgi:hypothetical protein